ncbi:MAG: recombinase family protein [Ruminococcus sp.]|nr:recombinase family protein [Ruminococcus sp.]
MKQPNTTVYNAALYLRLSKDDGLDNMESSSIQTQKEMLTRYCRENGISIADYYVDDGYSGTNFDRPSFKRMISDIEGGKVNCVITKDLSRLGRNYLETGSYTEIYFPERGVRYIAITDNVDTLHSATMDITPFRNLLNDMYAKDVSKKVKSALLTRQKQGKFTGAKAPYGYKKDPNDKNHLIVDERYAPVVRKIFELAKSGLGVTAISRRMRSEKIIRPAAVAADVNQSFSSFADDDKKYEWTNSAVRCILNNPVYTGSNCVLRRPTISMKSEKRANNGIMGQAVVRNCHEAIVSQEDWDLVQQLTESRRKVLGDGEERYENIFAGLLKCDACGHALSAHVNRRRKREFLIDKVHYQCNYYRIRGTDVCTQHWIEARDLYNAVLADIKRLAAYAAQSDEKMLENIIAKLRKSDTDKVKHDERDLKKFNKRLAELDKLFAKLYEDNASGKVSDRNYANLSSVYEKEQLELEDKIDRLNISIKESKLENSNAENFVELIKEYADITELSAAMLNTLIDKIAVHEVEFIDGERVQQLDVYYKFVGLID